MISIMALGAALVCLVLLHPRIALWIGLFFPLAQAFYSPSLIRAGVLGAIFLSVALSWKWTESRQRRVVTYIWLGLILALALGWVAAPNPSLATGVVVNLIYAGALANLAVVYRMRVGEWQFYLISWGVLVSVWLSSHDIVVTGRTGTLYIGENANALGILAALGFVAAFGLAVGRSHRLARVAAAVPCMAICGLGLIASGSRGALLVASSGLAVQLCAPLLRGSRLRALMGGMLLLASTAWVGIPILTWFLAKAGRDIEATTNFASREQILAAALHAGVDHPLWGVGFGNLTVSDIGVSGMVSAHNAYIGLFAATGVLPVVLLGLLIASAVGRARSSRDQFGLLPLLVAGAMVGISLDWVPTAKLGPIVLALLACAAALPIAASSHASSDPRTKDLTKSTRVTAGDHKCRD